MEEIFHLANKSFQARDYQKALEYYTRAVDRYQKANRAPTALIASCIRLIKACKMHIDLNPSSKISAEKKTFLQLGPESYKQLTFQNEPDRLTLPEVSLIIPHFNSGGLIYQALDSVANQNFKNIETIIVDDDSSDGSIDTKRLASYPTWMRVSLVTLSSNSGPSVCRNLGVHLSLGRGVCLLDADDALDGDTLRERWKTVNGDPNVVGSYSTMTYVDINNNPLGPIILKGVDSLSFDDFLSNKFPCSALLFRRRCLVQDPFDETLKYGEDYECFSRIVQRGGIYKLSPGTVWYKQHGSSLTHKDTLKDLQSRISVTRTVHRRRLDWAITSCTTTLPEALIIRETSLRSFPVACVYALRAQHKEAIDLATLINPDIISTKSPSMVAGSIRFFLTRENILPSSEYEDAVAASDLNCLAKFFSEFFSVRHQVFLSELIKKLNEGLKIPRFKPVIATDGFLHCTWEDFLAGPLSGNKWNGYIVVHRSSEHMPVESINWTSRFLMSRRDLEGLYAHRLKFCRGNVLVDKTSIAPTSPDSSRIQDMGETIYPALVLHEIAARALWAWLIKPPGGTREPVSMTISARDIEKAALQGIFQLRLKIIGGNAGCYVLQNP